MNPNRLEHCWAVVVAAGSGSRFGRPKQLEPLAGRRVIDWSVQAMARVAGGVVVVGPEELGSPAELGVDDRVVGGETRSDSVRNGLAAIPADVSLVLIHDAARPLVRPELVDRVVAGLLDGAGAVVPVVPVTDSLRTVEGETVDRARLVAVQTPQGFDLATLKEAHAGGSVASDDATLVAASGREVRHVAGEPDNLKITYPADLAIAEALLSLR